MSTIAPSGFHICSGCGRDDVVLIGGRCGRCMVYKIEPGPTHVTWYEEGPPKDDVVLVARCVGVLRFFLLLFAIAIVGLFKAVLP